MNNAGEIIFQAILSGGNVTGLNDLSMWLWNRGQLTLLLREGELFDVNPDPGVTEMHRISEINIAKGSAGDDGRTLGLNDQGQFAFVMSFQDGLTGIFTGSVVPEPSTGMLALLTLSLLPRQRPSGGWYLAATSIPYTGIEKSVREQPAALSNPEYSRSL